MKTILLNRKQRVSDQKPVFLLYALCSALCAIAVFSPLSLAETATSEDPPSPGDTQQSPISAAQQVEDKAEAQASVTMENTSLSSNASQFPRNEMNTRDPFSSYVSLYADHRARRVGDIVTIIITESSSASKSSATKTSKKSGTSGALSSFFGLGGMPVKMGVDAGSDYSGSGTTTRSGSMEAKISVFVKQVLPNGVMMLEGTSRVTVNDDIQMITISGTVRPEDVRADNSVLSMHMADAKIEYAGEGPIVQRPGIVTRILQTPFHWVAGAFRKIF